MYEELVNKYNKYQRVTKLKQHGILVITFEFISAGSYLDVTDSRGWTSLSKLSIILMHVRYKVVIIIVQDQEYLKKLLKKLLKTQTSNESE